MTQQIRTKLIVAIMSLGLIVASVLETAAQNKQVNAVKRALQTQVDAWNARDLEAAMAVYWNSPDMLWINSKGISRGYADILEGYKSDYQDRSKMGTYTYEPLFIERLSRSAVYYVFRWEIALDGKRQMGGVSSQVWKRIDGRWVITAEHAG